MFYFFGQPCILTCCLPCQACSLNANNTNLSPNSTWRVTSRHDTTRSSRRARQARLARHVFGSFATAWTGVDVSPPHFFQKFFPRLMQIQSTNRTHEHYCLFLRLPCWNKHGATRTTREMRAVFLPAVSYK